MNDLIQTESELKELTVEESFGSSDSAEVNQLTSMPVKDRDTMLSMVALLLACLGLAALAQAVM